MNSIRNEAVALDTNVFVFALRKESSYPACETLLFDKLNELQVYVPLQIFVELQRNLTTNEMRGVLGDAVIAAHLEAAKIHYFVSENRHFLTELSAPLFQVLRSEEAIRLLG